MALVIDTVDGHGLSNEDCHDFLSKKTTISHSFNSKPHLTSCTLLMRQSASVKKVGIPFKSETFKKETG